MAIPMTIYRVRLTFTEPLLGSTPDAKAYSAYVAQQAIDNGKYVNDEMQTLVEQPRGKTGFHRDSATPVIYDYVLKGFMKEACTALRRMDGTVSKSLTAHKTKIDQLVMVEPRRIALRLRKPTTDLERPLRADTPQGPRVTLVSSTAASEGTTMEFTVKVLGVGVISEAMLREWFEYGQFSGLGQWRSGGYGRFVAEITAVPDGTEAR
jgi:hypothetical protein